MPILGDSELNIVLAGLSGFVAVFAIFSYVIKGRLLLGEARMLLFALGQEDAMWANSSQLRSSSDACWGGVWALCSKDI